MREPIEIAYVEDTQADVLALQNLLQAWHVVNEVVNFPSGEYLLRALAAGHRPGIILIDLVLGDGMDGMEVLRVLRAEHSTLPAVPLIIVTGADNEYTVEAAKRCGADAYIVKPLGVPALMEAINQAAPFGLEIVRRDS